MNNWLSIFWLFIRVNLLTTSGPASGGLIYKETIDAMMSKSEFVEAVGFSSVLPGIDPCRACDVRGLCCWWCTWCPGSATRINLAANAIDTGRDHHSCAVADGAYHLYPLESRIALSRRVEKWFSRHGYADGGKDYLTSQCQILRVLEKECKITLACLITEHSSGFLQH